MKVLQVIDRLNVGGAEKVFLTLSSLLKTHGVAVDALLFEDGGELMQQLNKDIRLHILDRRNKYSIMTLKRLNGICRGYDIVHVHMRYCYTYVALAKKMFGGSYKIVLHDHFGDIEIDRTVPKGLRFFMPDAYIGVSSALREWAVAHLKMDAHKAFLLRNTVMPVQYDVKNKTSPDVCMIANFRKTKNIEFAISVFKQLGWPLTIYGHKNDETYYSKIVAMAASAPNIKLVTNRNGFGEIDKVHNLAIHTAVSESGPLVLLEYMQVGIPFLAYKTGEVAKETSTVLTELYMDNFNEEQWGQRLSTLWADKGYEQRLKEVFQNYFGTEKYTADCLQIYRNILC